MTEVSSLLSLSLSTILTISVLFSIPQHTTEPNKVVRVVEQSFHRNPSSDFFSSVKAYMGVNESFNDLGWKLKSERRGDHPHRLLNDVDYGRAFEAGFEAQSHATGESKLTRFTVEIFNLVSGGGSSKKYLVHLPLF